MSNLKNKCAGDKGRGARYDRVRGHDGVELERMATPVDAEVSHTSLAGWCYMMVWWYRHHVMWATEHSSISTQR